MAIIVWTANLMREILRHFPVELEIFLGFVIVCALAYFFHYQLIYIRSSIADLAKTMAAFKREYDKHIQDSIDSDRERLSTELRKLYEEIECLVEAKKCIPEELLSEFYNKHDLYVNRNGNGYHKRLKQKIDKWTE